MRVRTRAGVRRVIRRLKISWTSSGRPRSRFSRITCSKNSRPCTGKDRHIVAEAGLLIRGGERVGEGAPPLARQGVDRLARQAVADLAKPLGVGAAQHPIGERLIGDALPLQL